MPVLPVIAVPVVAPPLGDQRALALADKKPAPPPHTVTPLKRAAWMPMPRAGASRASGGTTVPTQRSKAPPPAVVAAPPILVHVAPESPPVAALVDSAPSTAAPVAAPVSAPVATPVPAAATAAPPVDAAAELKAIRDELNARKRRVDSLTKSLDSLRTVSPPR